MRKILLAVSAFVLSFSLMADEGMWLLPLIKQQKFDEMKKLGLKLDAVDIYNPDSASLKDGVVIFGRGCTGEMISSEGLLITNHHCGYGQIQQHSSLEHDYLTDGFWAMDRSQELPNPGLTVTFIESIDDVTDFVKTELAKETDPNSMNFLSPKYLNGLAKVKYGADKLNASKGIELEIKPFFGGNKYYMFTKKVYSDVRLVGAPPSSIGKFGADTDNWMWPRHTGDFSLFRVYADVNGQPAAYSPNNVPLRPKKYFKISMKGVQPNDYAMIMGFPGTTNKFYTSWEVDEREKIDNEVRIRIRDLRQRAMLEEMLNDPLVRIQYSSKYAGSTNGYKNAIGASWAINMRNFKDTKRSVQDSLRAWAIEHHKPEYSQALDSLEKMVTERAGLRYRKAMLEEALLRGVEWTTIPADFDSLSQALRTGDKVLLEKELKAFEKAYAKFNDKNYSQKVDRKITGVLLKEYMKSIPKGQRPAYFDLLEKENKGDMDRAVRSVFDRSIFTDSILFKSFVKKPSAKKLASDPLFSFVRSIKAEHEKIKKSLAGYDLGFAKAHRAYVKGLLEMKGELSYAPDANFTLRITYGTVNGYKAKDAVIYNHSTVLDGVIEKEDSTNWEFVVSPKLKELYKNKDFGRYANPDGTQPVAFAATTHTTGGNSGSPVLNANGELIGTNFDRNWEGVGGDIQYLPEYQRSIIVDVRYILFVIDKYAGAGYLLKEMDLVD
ncbi:MAG: S46 family peptidase [Bacteroidales bacterium]